MSDQSYREIKNVEDAEAVVVGESYQVNTVQTTTAMPWWGALMPVLGDWHEDREIIRFPYIHIHIDWRFVSSEFHSNIEDAVEIFVRNNHSPLYENLLLGMPLIERDAKDITLTRRSLRCERSGMMWGDNAGWLRALEAAYSDKRIPRKVVQEHRDWAMAWDDLSVMPPPYRSQLCGVCPHRGLSLSGAPTDERGAVVCMGHGLAWDPQTGRLAPRARFRFPEERLVL